MGRIIAAIYERSLEGTEAACLRQWRGARRALAALLCGAALAVAQAPAQSPAVPLRRGMVITRSVTIERRAYHLRAPASLDSAVITVRGSDIVIDLNGATLTGANAGDEPDQYAGVGIRVEEGARVTIRNGAVHGYRVNVLARGTRALRLFDFDAGRSWKPRLYSLVEHESLVDWLSFHHDEHGEWLRYGAGILLDGVRGGEIARVTAEQGMNGLLLARTDSLFIHDDTFSFNSGLGIGLYRSSANRILHDRLDFNVRGYSNGFYWRGQDSADLLMFEQSADNVVAYNSATHGGDGLFLWAGQSTMDSGQGGANDNLFFGNDFSWAPANAMEATFSRNVFLANQADGSDYGLWGGYSYESRIAGNCFRRDRMGVAIEHGQGNAIARNIFDSVTTAIRLWGGALEPSDWGYPKHRDTDSRDVSVAENAIAHARTGLSASDTRNLIVARNLFIAVDTPATFADTLNVRLDSNTVGNPEGTGRMSACGARAMLTATEAALSPHAPGVDERIPSTPLAFRDRSAIIVDEWGPYDWRTPKLWPIDSTHARPLRLAVLGPSGRWTVAARRGIASLSDTAGAMNDTITLVPAAGSAQDWKLTLKTGGALFSYEVFEPVQDWEVRFVAWGDSTDPRTNAAAFGALLAGKPLFRRTLPRLDFEWYRPKALPVPAEKWALEATTSVTLPPGVYTVRTISDDGVRVWIDGQLTIDDWTPHESSVAVVPISGGTHDLRVQYFQVDGWTELRVDIVRGRQRAGGSPPPHG